MTSIDQTVGPEAVRTGAPRHHARGAVRIPPNFFGIALGLSGLAGLWVYANESFGAPAAVGEGLGLVAALVWAALMVAYLRQGAQRILADGRDPTLGPFLAAPVMATYVLAAFTFPPANMAVFALRWLQLEHPPGGSAYAWVLIAAITVLVSSIAARTILAAARGQLLPSPGGAAALLPSPAAAPVRRAA
jgi:tellurite resistance protein TehA-like permease